MVFQDVLEANTQVCPLCEHHLPIRAMARLEAILDPEPVEVHDQDLVSLDPLGFVDSKPYPERLRVAEDKTGMTDAFVGASGKIGGIAVEIGAFDFRFLGGSMGSVVGERVTRLIERATAARHPLILISASGGARMQEGVLSLMQLATTAGALADLKDEAKMPYISVLAHPTTGGVAASFATLGDVILAEPGALIGFAGPRVIEQTIGRTLPEGFQTSEYLLAHGMIDRIVHRRALRPTLEQLLRLLLRLPARGEA